MVTNQVILVGQVDFLTFANTKHGNRFCRFNLRINNSDGSHVRVFCLCFDEGSRRYFDHNVTNGDTIEVHGSLTSYQKQVPGLQHGLTMNSVRVSFVGHVREQGAEKVDSRGIVDYDDDPYEDDPYDAMGIEYGDMPF